jgi:uncharacterized protein (TIGR02266 family)
LEAAHVEHRRSDRRYDRRLEIDVIHEGRTMSSFTRNISLGGVFIDCDQALPFGAKVQLKFRVPTQTEQTVVDGQVRWVEMEEGQVKGIGIRFEGLRARDVWALNKFFEKPVEENR